MVAPPLPAPLTMALLPSRSGEGAARSTGGGAGRAASRSGGSSPPDPARAAAAGSATGRAAGAAAAGPAGHPNLQTCCIGDETGKRVFPRASLHVTSEMNRKAHGLHSWSINGSGQRAGRERDSCWLRSHSVVHSIRCESCHGQAE